MRGKFITLYGINNIGKSTQAKLLVEHLNKVGQKAIYLKYPIYDLAPTGPKLNEILRGGKQKISEEELQSLFVQNRVEFEPQLVEYLEAGTHVVAEDYVGTGIAWGAAKGADLEWLEAINAPLLKEDLTLYMYGERFSNAQEKDHIHESNDELMKKCADVYEFLAEKYDWKGVKVEGGIEMVSEKIWGIVKDFLAI